MIITILLMVWFIGTLFLLSLMSIYMIRSLNPKLKNDLQITNENTEMFLKELDRMILYNSIYQIDVTFGKNFSERKGVSPEIENDEIYNAAISIQKAIIESMSPLMKSYLYTTFGEEWIYNYINIQTTSIVLNYTQFNIKSLTETLFR